MTHRSTIATAIGLIMMASGLAYAEQIQDNHFAATKTACSRSSLPASIETLTP